MEQPEQQQRQQAKRPNEGPPKRCPRCESTNTKFCYFNNYSASQPRHFCKTCRRYWTEGGSLRNIPNEGGRANRRRRSRRSSPAAASTSAAVATINPSDRPLNNNDQGPPAAAITMADHAHSQVPPSLYLWTGDLADTRRVGGGLERCTAALRSLNSEASHLGGFQASPLRMPPSLNYPLLFGLNYHVPQQQQQQQLGFHVSGGDRTLHQLPPVNNTNLKVQPRPSTSVAQRGWELSTTPLQQRLTTSVFTTSATTPATTPDGATAGAGADSFWTDLFTGVGGSGHWASELSGPAPRANSPSSFI